ncbi:MAG: hypothetical protein QGF78_00920 [Candidatus Bathyarchaeota archaeon]|nr:hypothetical protein [Candidatus Bathyarchaeota archaeon]
MNKVGGALYPEDTVTVMREDKSGSDLGFRSQIFREVKRTIKDANAQRSRKTLFRGTSIKPPKRIPTHLIYHYAPARLPSFGGFQASFRMTVRERLI